MSKLIVGIFLIVTGGVVAVLILSGGGPVLPHIAGPIVFGTSGTVLVISNRRGASENKYQNGTNHD